METEAYLYNGRDKWGKFIPILSNDCFFSPLTIFFLFFNNRNSRILGGHMVYQKVSFPILPSSLETNVGIWLIFDQGRRKKICEISRRFLQIKDLCFFFFSTFFLERGHDGRKKRHIFPQDGNLIWNETATRWKKSFLLPLSHQQSLGLTKQILIQDI